MRHISTIGLISAAAALSFFCANAVRGDTVDDPIVIVATASWH